MQSLRATQERYARHYLVVAEQAKPHLTRAEQGTCLERLELELSHLRAVLRWAYGHGEQHAGLQPALREITHALSALEQGGRWAGQLL
jgi:predicted ATPase